MLCEKQGAALVRRGQHLCIFCENFDNGRKNFEDMQKKTCIFEKNAYNIRVTPAGVMELVDVVDSKSTAGDSVPVRVRPPAPKQYNPNQLFRVGDGFGFIVYFTRYDQAYFANGWKIRPESKPRGPRGKKKQI